MPIILAISMDSGLGGNFKSSAPLRVWDPSGFETKLGTKYMVDRMKEMYSRDGASRLGMYLLMFFS